MNANSIRVTSAGQAGNAIYGLGILGAWVYFWMRAGHGLWPHALAVLEGLVWPAFVVYHGLERLGA
ncbi:MAG: hypothetical protein M0Z51_00205 [Propionibacterium sp.]|nr:hypothetical protein [Propionibacterium sp.]